MKLTEALKKSKNGIMALLGIVTTIRTFLPELKQYAILFWNQMPQWLVVTTLLTFTFLLTTVTLATANCLGLRQVTSTFRQVYRTHPARLARQMATTVLLIACCSMVAVSLIWGDEITSSNELNALFPQALAWGPARVATYATNGSVKYSVESLDLPFGPKLHARITFHTHGTTVQENCGWVIYLLKGTDLSAFTHLRFRIRGNRGGEEIGVKAKDAEGAETRLDLKSEYLSQGGAISSAWQEVFVPLAEFKPVKIDFMDNFSLFADGLMAQRRPQTIYVGDFQLITLPDRPSP